MPPRLRTTPPRCNPDASLLRLETPAACPVPGARDCARNGRCEYRRPESDGRRPPSRRNVSSTPGLLALESGRLPDRARRGGCGRVSGRPLRLERPRPDAGAASRGGGPRPLGRPRERDSRSRGLLGPESGSRPRGRSRSARVERDEPRPGQWLARFLRTRCPAAGCGPGPRSAGPHALYRSFERRRQLHLDEGVHRDGRES